MNRFVGFLIAIVLLGVSHSCAHRGRERNVASRPVAHWATGLSLPLGVRDIELGMRFSALRQLRESAMLARHVGLSEQAGRWTLNYRFQAGAWLGDPLDATVWREPDAAAPLLVVQAYSYTRVADGARLDWQHIVSTWRKAGVSLHCWQFSDGIGDGKLAAGKFVAGVATVFFSARQPGWEGPAVGTSEMAPMGYVQIDVVRAIAPAMLRARGNSVECDH